MAIVVVYEGGFVIVVFTTPLDGLRNITASVCFAIWIVGIGGADIASRSKYFANVLGYIPAVGVPCTVFADSERA